MSKESSRRYLEKKGFLKPKPTTFSRSENGVRYQYDDRIARRFAGWSYTQRKAGKEPVFGDFYNVLPKQDQATISVTQIFKDNETN